MTSVKRLDLHRCPRTGRALEERGDALVTSDGRVRYPVVRGVPDFRLEPSPDPADEATLDAMTADAARDGWRAALGAHRPDTLRYADDPARAGFLDLLPLRPDTVALEVGPGLGQLVAPLARRVGFVCAVELSPGQARFAAERCRQDGLDDVCVAAGGDDLLLPYADACFDVVVLNHVIEWARSARDPQVTREGQKILLREIRRVLAPRGVLYVATKNRYALRLLLGDPDENARYIRFGHALPRPIRQRLAAGRPGTLGLLHSYGGLARLLREAGLAPRTSYWVGPDSRFPRWYVATDAASVKAARAEPGFEQGATRKTRLVMPLVPDGLVKYVAPGIAFVAARDDAA